MMSYHIDIRKAISPVLNVISFYLKLLQCIPCICSLSLTTKYQRSLE